MVLKRAVVQQDNFLLEVEGKLFLGGLVVFICDGLEKEHFVVIGLVVVVVVVGDVEEEGIVGAVGGDGNAVEVGEGYAAADFVLVFEVDELLHEGFEDVVVFEDVKNGLIGEDEYPFLALAIAVVLHDFGGENHPLVLLEQTPEGPLLLQVQKITRFDLMAALLHFIRTHPIPTLELLSPTYQLCT